MHGAVCACILSLFWGREGNTPHETASRLDVAKCHLLLHRPTASLGAPPLA
jgi:hypothetical protein